MILITGASGTIGRQVVRQLATGKSPCRALVRKREQADALQCDYALGDFDDRASLERALVGVDSLFLNHGEGPDMVRQQSAVIDAAVHAGVSYIVKLSSAGADHASTITIRRWHAAVEDRLRASGVRWSLLQAAGFMQNLLHSARNIQRDSQFFGAYGSGLVPLIDAKDIAACAASLLQAPQPGKTFVLTGPEAFTYAEIATKLSALLGRSIRYLDVPAAEIEAQVRAFGRPPEVARGIGEVMRYFAEGGSIPLTESVQRLTGRAAHTLDTWLSEHAAIFR